MRMSATKIVGALAIGGLLVGSTGCGALETVTGGKKKAACENIEAELRSFSSSGMSMTVGNPEAAAQKFTDTAAKIRSEGQSAGGDVETAATAFAGDLDKTADLLRQMSSGNFSAQQPDLSSIRQHGNDLAEACGFTAFRLG
ncbi:MAG TPA: hypothetical protein VIL71_08405 [Spirillospora sp.]